MIPEVDLEFAATGLDNAHFARQDFHAFATSQHRCLEGVRQFGEQVLFVDFMQVLII